MAQLSFMEQLNLKAFQVEEKHKQSNEIHIPPHLQVETLMSCNQIENKPIQEVEFNFDELSSNSVFSNFINIQPINSQSTTIALITGLPGVGKSQLLIEIEKYFWKQFQIDQHLQIVPMNLIFNKFDDILTQNNLEQQILEQYNFDESFLQQSKELINNGKIQILFLIDFQQDIQINEFSQLFQFFELLNQQWKGCKIILTLKLNTIKLLKKYQQNSNISIIYTIQNVRPNSQLIVCEILGSLYIWKVDQSSFIQKFTQSKICANVLQSTEHSIDSSEMEDTNLYYNSYLKFLEFSIDSQQIAFYFDKQNAINVLNVRDFNICCQIFIDFDEHHNYPQEKQIQQFFSVSVKDSQINSIFDNFISVQSKLPGFTGSDCRIMGRTVFFSDSDSDNSDENSSDKSDENSSDNSDENSSDNSDENSPDNSDENSPDNSDENSSQIQGSK